jgi:hypothetical protein
VGQIGWQGSRPTARVLLWVQIHVAPIPGDHSEEPFHVRRAQCESPDAGRRMSADPDRPNRPADATEREMEAADEANGEGSAANDTESRYGEDESPA